MKYLRPHLGLVPSGIPEDVRKKRDSAPRPKIWRRSIFRIPSTISNALETNSPTKSFRHPVRGNRPQDGRPQGVGRKAKAIVLNAERVKEILAKLPFEMTGKQKISLFQVLKDMEKPHSMTRLLQGDVGAGKTAVAFVAAIHAIMEAGVQVALMAVFCNDLEFFKESFCVAMYHKK